MDPSHGQGREDLCASGGGGTAEQPSGADAGDAFEAAVCPVPLGSTGIHWDPLGHALDDMFGVWDVMMIWQLPMTTKNGKP